jgi:hypothetical protein
MANDAPRFVRFARAITLATGLGGLGCGNPSPLHVMTTSDAGGAAGGTGTPFPPPEGLPGVPRPQIDADDNADAPVADASSPYDGRILGVVVQPDDASSGYDGRLMGVVPLPPSDASEPYDGRFFGIGPPPPSDASSDAGQPRDAAVADVVIERIPVGGPPAAPAPPEDWFTAEAV